MNISIAAKFALTISAIGMLASTALGWYSYSSTREVLQSEIRHKLEAVRENKGKDVLEDLRDNLNRAAVFSAEPEATEALALLMAHARAGGVSRDGSFDVTSAEYERIFRKIMPPILSRMAITRSLRDIFLVSADNGQVMFSIARGRDLGTNLRAGPYRSSALARTWERVIATGRPYLADFSLYEPAGMACLFVGAPVFDEQQRVSAVVIEQFSSERLTEILQQEAGFGASGEVFLIGEDKLIRTKLRNLPD
ncbi:MAG: cache domain-containing protein, partial [Spirochaetota bacterium]